MGHPPRELAERLAAAKAGSLVDLGPDAVILGSDQVCALGDEVLSKPGSRDAAFAMLQNMRGKTHALWTAVSIHHGTRQLQHVDHTTLTMRELSDAEIGRYLDHDEPYDCAGSYKLEQLGIALFESIESEDHSAVTGLPLLAVTRMLRTLGFSIP